MILRVLLAFALLTSQLHASRDFDGSDDYADCGDPGDDIMIENGPVDVNVWIRPDSQGESSLGRIFQRGALLFYFTGSSNRLTFQVFGSTSLVRVTAVNTVTMNVWQHFRVTWDGSTTAANADIFKNGTEVSYETTTNGATLSNSTGNLFIGNNGTDAIRSYDGEIADFAAFNVQLTNAEGGSIAKGTPAWKFRTTAERKVYVPFWGVASPEPNLGNSSLNCTISGAIANQHPPVRPLFGSLFPKFDLWAGFLAGWRYAFGG